MNRNVPVVLLKVLVNWYDKCAVFVRWNNVLWRCFYLMNGVSQGGVLSPLLFSVYVNDMIQKLCDKSLGCYVSPALYEHQSCHRTLSYVHWRHTCFRPHGTVDALSSILITSTYLLTYLLTQTRLSFCCHIGAMVHAWWLSTIYSMMVLALTFEAAECLHSCCSCQLFSSGLIVSQKCRTNFSSHKRLPNKNSLCI